MNYESGIEIVTASPADEEEISSILIEAAEWLISKGEKLWEPEEVSPEAIAEDVRAGMYSFAMAASRKAGCYRFQTEDVEFWDDVPHDDSAFIHRVAVRREFAGMGIARAMIDNAKSRARALGKRYLRLDCADRPKLRAVYERQGFVFHSIRQRLPFDVARYQFEISQD
jgi:GNAT superfamily N-acetyltransferase